MTNGVLIEQLRSGVCRFPLWDSRGPTPSCDEARYCGQPVEGERTYCSGCLSVVYRYGWGPTRVRVPRARSLGEKVRRLR